MPKTTPKPKPKTKKPAVWTKAFTWCNNHPVLTIATVVFVGLFGYVAVSSTVSHIQINKERKQYAQLRVDMDNLYAQVVKQVGEPVAREDVSSCRYTSVLTGTGTRTCVVTSYFVHEGADSNVHALANKISKIVSGQPTVHDYIQYDLTSSEQEYSLVKPGNFTLNNKSALGCTDAFWGRVKLSGEFSRLIPAGLDTENALLVKLSCGGGAKAEYFPVVKE